MWDVNGLIIRIFGQWWEDIYRWWGILPEKGQFIWKCFTFAGDRPVFNNKHICLTIPVKQWSSETSARAYTDTSTHIHTTFGISFYGVKEQTLRLGGGILLPLATGGKKKKQESEKQLLSLSSLSVSGSSSQPQLFFSLVMHPHCALQARQTMKTHHGKNECKICSYCACLWMLHTLRLCGGINDVVYKPHDDYFWK